MQGREQERRRQRLPNGDPRLWRRHLAIARAALGLLCLLVQSLRVADLGIASLMLPAVFATYGLGVLGLRRIKAGDVGLLGLILDTVFFLAWFRAGADPGFWVSSAFYLYLLLSAVLLHNWWDVAAVAGACALFVIFVRPGGEDTLGHFVVGAGLLASVLALEKSRTERRLTETACDAEDWRSRAAQAAEDERQRIAGDFHDGPLQSYISFQIRLEALRKILMRDLPSGLKELGQIQEILRSQIGDLRAFVRGTRAVETDGQSLLASLRRVVDDFQKESGLLVSFQSGEANTIESRQASQDVIQVLREALHNVQKHAGATQIAVTAGHAGGGLEITIADNGRGFDFGGIFDLDELELLRLGPESIKRRVRKLDGQLTVDSRPGRGATLRVRIPA